jgi:7-carboxy-7-deazaguanine synthase
MFLRLARNDAGEPEVFRSIQGEGRNIGRVRTFIRLSGCNLHCVWCDTAYTWNWIGSPFRHERDAPGVPHKFDPAAEMSKVSIADACTLIEVQKSEGVVITGGEPLMQAEAIVALVDALKANDPQLLIEIETNGSIAPSEALTARVDLFMVSPKLAHSGNDPDVALKAKSLEVFAGLEKAVFKFVARTGDDVDAVSAVVRNLKVPPERVYVMPEGTTSKTLVERGRLLAQAALDHGFNYTDRLHIHLFGEARGV